MAETGKSSATGSVEPTFSTACPGEAEAEPEVPAIFAGAREYRDDPAALEAAQATFNEEALYQAIAQFAVDWHRRTGRPARVLDLCCATGLTAYRVEKVIPVASFALVDTDPVALSRAEQRFVGRCRAQAFCEDAVTFQSGRPYDLILMNSAYHHIENERKLAFLRNAAELLAQDGEILVGEHFLPEYRDQEEYRQAVVEFYAALIHELDARSESSEAIAVIRRAGRYGWEGIYEYKTSLSDFEKNTRQMSLSLEYRKLWLHYGLARIGTMAVRVTP
jgi:SAM-dependent methyltransferase